MLFTLKKVIGNMLLPLPLMLLIIGAGLALLWFSRFQKTGKIFISIGWLALLLLSLQPVADRLLRPIESTYPTWNIFTLKKVIGNMLLPLPLMLLIIGAGLALLWFSRFQKTGKIFISIGWLALLLLSLQPVADRLLRPIESTYPTWNNSQKVDYIVVLGGGYTWNPQWAPSSNLINNSLPRLNEGIRLWRENPGSKLIFTGGVAKTNTVSTAEVGARVAQSLGVPREQIITLDLPKDTEEEAAAVKQAIACRASKLSPWICQKIPKKKLQQ